MKKQIENDVNCETQEYTSYDSFFKDVLFNWILPTLNFLSLITNILIIKKKGKADLTDKILVSLNSLSTILWVFEGIKNKFLYRNK